MRVIDLEGADAGSRHCPLRGSHLLDNSYDYGDTYTFFISLIIKVGVMNTPFGGYACGWLRIIILRDGEHKLHIQFTPNLFFSDGRNKVCTNITVIAGIVNRPSMSQ